MSIKRTPTNNGNNTSMLDKIAEIVKIQALYMGGRDTAVAILEALPGMIAPLVWSRNGNHWAGGHGYVIRNLNKTYLLTIRNRFEQEFNTFEDAQVFANSDYCDATMAAFTSVKEIK
jgi:hypothetical protein